MEGMWIGSVREPSLGRFFFQWLVSLSSSRSILKAKWQWVSIEQPTVTQQDYVLVISFRTDEAFHVWLARAQGIHFLRFQFWKHFHMTKSRLQSRHWVRNDQTLFQDHIRSAEYLDIFSVFSVSCLATFDAMFSCRVSAPRLRLGMPNQRPHQP